MENIAEYAQLGFAVIGAFSALATITPNEHDNKFVDQLVNFVNALAMNLGKSKNAP
ncbi:MAG: hypothetical protein GY737_00300 [Desulfobacteraceae bacterium]|nr:hypothetical protein [Desulfobacteraceae bacterium]